jgi:hypothetical protein
MHGFYYLPPKDSDAWRFGNGTCILLFYPLNALDRWLGFGLPPASEPLWGLSAASAAGNLARPTCGTVG